MADYKEKVFWGTAQTVINSAVDVATGNFSVTTTTFDNTGNGGAETVCPYAPYAQAMIEVPDFAAAPADGTVFDLFALLLNVDGSDDETQAPSGAAQGGGRYMGSFRISANDALQRRAIKIDIEDIEQCDFYIRNATAQNANNDAGTNLVVKIRPYTKGVTA